MVYNRKTIHLQRLFDTQIMSGSILYIAIIFCTFPPFLYHFFLLFIQETNFKNPQFFGKKFGDSPNYFFLKFKASQRSPSPFPDINNGRSLSCQITQPNTQPTLSESVLPVRSVDFVSQHNSIHNNTSPNQP